MGDRLKGDSHKHSQTNAKHVQSEKRLKNRPKVDADAGRVIKMGWFGALSTICRDATRLMVTQSMRDLTKSERLGLKVHLMGCRSCKRFQKQMRVMDALLDQVHQSQPENIKDSKQMTIDTDWHAARQSRICRGAIRKIRQL